jgi:hypothetical protein
MKSDKINYEEFTKIFDDLRKANYKPRHHQSNEVEDLSSDFFNFYLYYDGLKFFIFFTRENFNGIEIPKSIEIKEKIIVIDDIEVKINSLTFSSEVEVDLDYIISIYYLLYSRLFINKSISKSIQEMTAFFEVRSQSLNEYLGLLGEIIFISSAESKKELISMWHSDIDNKFDFSGSKYYEVKSTLSRKREHYLSSDQLNKALNPKIVSVKIQHVEEGTNIHELITNINMILDKETSIIFNKKLEKYSILKSNLSFDFKFNYEDTKNSIKFFSIPAISIEQDYPFIINFDVKINFDLL